MKVAIMANLTRERAFAVTVKVCEKLRELGIEYAFNDEFKNRLIRIPLASFEDVATLFSTCDIVICIGGDGTVIHTAKIASAYGKKILGINAGRIGFLCDVDADELFYLDKLLTGEYNVCSRMMLSTEITRDGKMIANEHVLNDVVFGRGTEISLCNISVKVNGKQILNYIADGIILSTPTGSTAYSMSAGGPIIEPTLEAIMLTPICPQTLVSRPFIFDGNAEFEVVCKPMHVGSDPGLSCDGGETMLLQDCDVVTVRRSSLTADIISIRSDNFIDVLNRKTEFKSER